MMDRRRGFAVTGPTKSGKSTLARLLCREGQSPYHLIEGFGELGTTAQAPRPTTTTVHLTGSGFLVTQEWGGAVVAGTYVAKFRALEEAAALEARYVASRAR